MRSGDVRWFRPHGEREPEHHHAVPSDYVQGTFGGHRLLLIPRVNRSTMMASRRVRAARLAISIELRVGAERSRNLGQLALRLATGVGKRRVIASRKHAAFFKLVV